MATPREIMQAAAALDKAWEELGAARDRRDQLSAKVDELQADLAAARAAVQEKQAAWDIALQNLKAIA